MAAIRLYRPLFVDFYRIFEMPLLGYLGYIAFSWELFAIYQLVSGWIPALKKNYIRI